jgi:aspartate beta-hydroxylase
MAGAAVEDFAQLEAQGQRAFRSGDLAGAREHYRRLVAVDGRDPQQWVNLAVVCQGLKDEAGGFEP